MSDGRLDGMVIDAVTKRPIGGVAVTVDGSAIAGEQTVTTDASGAFSVASLSAGHYELRLDAHGYAPQSHPIALAARQAHQLRFELSPLRPSQ